MAPHDLLALAVAVFMTALVSGLLLLATGRRR